MRFSAAIQSPPSNLRAPVEQPPALGAAAASNSMAPSGDGAPAPLTAEEQGQLDERVRQSGEW
jgi:hypothetical protein